jgi:hypothetical protein
MEFEHVEYEFPEGAASPGRRVSSLLVEHGYQSLYRDSLELVQRYLPGGGAHHSAAPGPPSSARTVDVLIPPAAQAIRILVCERPAAGAPGGTAVAVVAVGPSQEEAHRARTAAKVVLDAKAGAEDGPAARTADDGRARARRFRQEWARDLGLVRSDRTGDALPPASSSRSLAALKALFALQDASSPGARPAALRSRLDDAAQRSGALFDAGLLDGLVSEGLVDRAFVLVCRDTGQIVGVGKSPTEIQAAAQFTLRCPHCRRPMGEEIQDTLYTVSAQGAEAVQSSRWIREAVDAVLRNRGCDAWVAANGAGHGVDAAACYQDAVLLFRVTNGTPSREDVQAFVRALAGFKEAAPGVPVRGVYVAAEPAPADVAGKGAAACTILEVSRLEAGLDRLLDEVKRANFVRLTGTALEIVWPDPTTLLAGGPA